MSNRSKCPEIAKLWDDLKAAFDLKDVKFTWIKEGDFEVGKQKIFKPKVANDLNMWGPVK